MSHKGYDPLWPKPSLTRVLAFVNCTFAIDRFLMTQNRLRGRRVFHSRRHGRLRDRVPH